MKKIIIITLILISLFAGCGEKDKLEKPLGEQFTVFVTIPPLASLADSIGGKMSNVEVVLKPGSNPHTYEPTPKDIVKLSNSALLFEIGIGLDEWATEVALEAENGPRVVPVAIGIPTLPALSERLRRRHLDENKIAAHGNPHVWLDPNIVSDIIIPTMTKAYTAADPPNADYYRANSFRLTELVRSYAQDARTRLDKLKGKPVILQHGAFVYFFRQYGIPVMDILEPFPGQEPTMQDITEIIEVAKVEKPVAIIIESQLSPKPARVLAEELGIPLITMDPLGKNDESYLTLMQRNLIALEEISIE